MSSSLRELIPFGKSPSDLSYQVRGIAQRHRERLLIEYHLEGDLTSIVFPQAKGIPQRRDQLWEHTCFEAFLRLEPGEKYWELNLSPQGDWNLYRFKRYREEHETESRISGLVSQMGFPSDRIFRAQVEIDFSQVFSETPGGVWYLGLTTVVEEVSGNKTYWALKHSGTRPDFHLKESFCLRL